MKITQIDSYALEVDAATTWVCCEVAADDVRGFGEALAPRGQDRLVQTALREAGRCLVGTEVAQAALPMLALADEQATGLFESTVNAALDQALWDLRARCLGVPLFKLLGPSRRREIALYANINRGTKDRSPRGFAVRAKQAAEDGFQSVKIAPFDGLTRANAHRAQGRYALSEAIARVEAVREAIGPERRLMIDCHCRLDLSSALEFLKSTQSVRIDWFEDALPYRDLVSWGHLKAASSAPLVGGETARGTRDLLPFLERGIWDVIMPDIRFFGGVTELTALAPLAAQFQVQIAPHNPRGPIGTLASAHCMAACPVFDHLEFQYAECCWRGALTRHSEDIRHGVLHLSDAPGIGLAWDDAVATAHRCV
ncbi:MAG: mandelate racemase/muconate lactonizing enzyme family protein [Gammaproteobacteria bacterium]|nr:mandelate racemase/muconate lactonizing enzyme family protein [Gammaproteobacteria bacterium]